MLTVGKMLRFTSECINERGEYFTSGNGFRQRDQHFPNRLELLVKLNMELKADSVYHVFLVFS